MSASTASSSSKDRFASTRPFVRGCLAGCIGWLPVHPFDVLKTRAQVIPGARDKSVFVAARLVVRTEGPRALYDGLSAALTRQAVYTTLRLGLYETFRDKMHTDKSKPVPVVTKLGSGLAAGGLASLISTPVEVSMVRMYADGALPAAQKRGYRNIFHALTTIASQEGVTSLWRGAGPTVTRAMVVNAVQLGVYDQAKDVISASTPISGVPLHLSASTTSGFVYSVASLPIDNCKSRMQSQHPLPDGTLQYTSIPQAVVRIARTEGVLALWAGFLPYFCRCGGHTVGMFLAFEQIKKFV